MVKWQRLYQRPFAGSVYVGSTGELTRRSTPIENAAQAKQNERSNPRLLIVQDAIEAHSALARCLSEHFDLIFPGDAGPAAGGEVGSSELVLTRVEPGDGQASIRAEALASTISNLPALEDILHAARALRHAGQAVCLYSYDGDLIWGNTNYLGLPENVKSKMASACIESALAFEATNRPTSMKDSQHFECDVEGDETSYEMIVSPAINPEGEEDKQKQVVGLVWDNSRQKKLQRKIDAIDSAGSELVRIESETVASLNTAERLGLLEDNIIRYTRDLLHFDHFNVYILEESTNRLVPVMMVGMPAEVAFYELYASSEGSGISGEVAATAQSCICDDVTADKRYLQGLAGAGSSLSVPLQLHDKIVGVFNVESKQKGAFSEDDRQFAEIFGRYVALALNILDLLVVERCATSGTVAVNVIAEINQPLNDITTETQVLRERLLADPETTQSLDRILTLVDNVRTRVRDVAQGPRNILGLQEELDRSEVDPLFEGRRVLVVDDEANIRNTIANVLSKRGAQVTVAENGARAIDVLEEAPKGSIGLVLSDISMPDRNGYEVFASARELHPDAPVILMTGFGYDPHHSIVRASQEGLQCVIFKPFQVDQMLEEVTNALSGEPSAGSSPGPSNESD